MRLPQSLPLQYRFLVRQHITPFDDVDFRQPARSGVSMRHDFKQGVPVELGFHYALDYLVELRTCIFREFATSLMYFPFSFTRASI